MQQPVPLRKYLQIMLSKEERVQYILEQLKKRQKVEYAELSLALKVSEDTVRRDINELAGTGLISKVKGGALPKTIIPASFQNREIYATGNKEIIARKATALFKDGQTVIFDGGTTPYLIAASLPHNIALTVITHSFPVANLFLESPSIELIFVGGPVSRNSKITGGIDAYKYYEGLHVDICILGVHSIHHEFGITDPIAGEATVKELITTISDKVIAVPTAEKMNAVSTYKVCMPSAIDTLVTDLEPGNSALTVYHNKGITII